MKRILAIDPGTIASGFVVWDGRVIECGQINNGDLLGRLKENNFGGLDFCAIEMVACYGMPVGKEVFETCVWIGRFLERSKVTVGFVYRKDVKIHLCGTTKAKDGNIRQALIDKHGIVGTKKTRGPLFGVSGHLWAALAVADYAAQGVAV